MALALFGRNGLVLGPRAQSLAQRYRARDAERLRCYRELLDFYQGKHFPSGDRSRAGRTSLVVNYPRAVVDKGVSYLFGRGIHVAVPATDGATAQRRGGVRRPHPSPLPEGEGTAPLSPPSILQLPTPSAAERLLAWLAEENDLDLLLLQAATNASVLGDAFLKVLWDPALGRARIVNVDPVRAFPTWAVDDIGALREVAVVGAAPSPDPPPAAGEGALESVEVWTADTLRVVVGDRTVREGPNPYGFIPFVHVANLQPPNTPWGASDLLDVIPLVRELDERMSDQADLIRYHADPPVVFRGIEEHSDLPVGPGTVWDIPRDADVSLLEWRGSPPAVGEHLERILRLIYEVAETPRTSFGDSGRLLSGVALETELQPLLQRTLRKRVGWSAALRRLSRMALVLTERFGPGLAPGAFAPYRTQVIWPPMLPRDDDAEARRNLALVGGGLRSHRSAMEALGELDAEAELRRMVADRAAVDSAVIPSGAKDPRLGGTDSSPAARNDKE